MEEITPTERNSSISVPLNIGSVSIDKVTIRWEAYYLLRLEKITSVIEKHLFNAGVQNY